jgi:predicted glutamine amidotransferase
VGSDFEKFVALSAEHKDGWGIGYEGEVIKDINPAKESELLTQTGKSLETEGALFHLRLASKGITVNIDNNHPFTYGNTTFMHNGTIRPSDAAEEFISDKYKALITGTTDSERLFYALLSQVDELGLVEGVRNVVNLVRSKADYSALNIMVQTPGTLIAVCEFNDSNQSEWSGPDHYELRFIQRDEDFLIASTGWGNADWQHLDNHHMLVVNRSTLEHSISSL